MYLKCNDKNRQTLRSSVVENLPSENEQLLAQKMIAKKKKRRQAGKDLSIG
jgi:hypothetical protein